MNNFSKLLISFVVAAIVLFILSLILMAKGNMGGILFAIFSAILLIMAYVGDKVNRDDIE